MFIPKRLQQWAPVRVTHARCHWCTGDPVHVSEMVNVMEGPMRWRFCCVECVYKWQEHRHDEDILEWLKCGTGERAKVLVAEADEGADPATSEVGRRLAGLRSDSRVALSMQPRP